MDQLREKMISIRIRKGSGKDVFLHLKPSKDSSQKAAWRKKVIQHLRAQGRVRISEPEDAITQPAESPNAGW